jgi:hypothetical protein
LAFALISEGFSVSSAACSSCAKRFERSFFKDGGGSMTVHLAGKMPMIASSFQRRTRLKGLQVAINGAL